MPACGTVAPVRPGAYYHSASYPSERWHRGCLEKLGPHRLIVFPHRYQRDCTGGAKNREKHFIFKRDRTRCHPSHNYGMQTLNAKPSGRLGRFCTFSMVQRIYWWIEMNAVMLWWLHRCLQCQVCKASLQTGRRPLFTFPLPSPLSR